ncbi:helix-hairpin-helix domain-containing protein [Kitasatospora aureofaciens]|uniref:helix-hairpin-helix domain-containing protein n=1 Tax=Kitasatospora aureofaciens TaxID=1894 RepID=UPI001DF08975|nr:helix-hairpin-helix domain-containing protein [Kitasatospora aureofaciens]HJD85501.1 ATP-binding domain-containing protein [Kitasatospora aureofaciens]
MSDTGNGAPEATPGVRLTAEEKAAKFAELAQRIRGMQPEDAAASAARAGAARAEASMAEAPESEPAVPAEQAAPPVPAPAAPATPAAPSTPVLRPAEPSADVLQRTVAVLSAGGAPVELAAAAVAAFGDGAAERLREDPWAVLGLPGVRPEHADHFARGLLGASVGPDDPRRAQALVVWVLEQAALRGHSAQELSEVAAGLERLRMPEPATAVEEALADGRVLPFQEELTGAEAHASAAGDGDEDEPPTRTLLALETLAMAEVSLAEKLLQLMASFVPGEDGGEQAGDEPSAESESESEPEGPAETAPVSPAPAAWEAAAEAAPSSSATALIRAVAGSALVLHTGGEAARAEPAALLAAATGLGLRAWAATWTDQGKASFAALGEAGSPVVTLAELLSGTAGPGRAADGTLALDLLIVLDAPLLDVELAATVLESLADGTRLVLSGDPGQLWSAGPGRFFADLLAAKVCPAVASRTPDFGPIGELVSGVGIGELQPVEAPDKEVVILTAKDGGEAVHRAVQLLTDSIPRALGIPAEQVVLLTPGHGGPAGTRALNAAAKARLNPGPGRFGGFDPGDRVVESPAPGVVRPARVVDGDAAGLHLEYPDGSRRTVPPAEAGRLRHGWALTVHQALGRRWPAAVVVVPEDAAPALSRQWVYTAFGRGERHLSVVHAAGPALVQAVAERPAQPRTTRLRAILAENAVDAG